MKRRCERRCRTDQISQRVPRGPTGHASTRSHLDARCTPQRPWPINPYALCVRTEMAPARKTVPASAANDMPLAARQVAHLKIRDVRSDRDNLAHEFVPDDERNRNRGSGPQVPFIDMEIRSANTRIERANLHVIDAGLGLLHLFHPHAASIPTFHQGFHFRRSSLMLSTPTGE
jgi:hypothetical protein